MTHQIEEPNASMESKDDNRNRFAAGVALILIGLLIFLAQLLQLDNLQWLILPGLAVIFLVWGLATRTFGLIIPGGILAGIGLGVYLMSQPSLELAGEGTAGIFMVAFSAGWALITLLSPLTDEGFQWWPLIPGGIIGLVGLALISGETGLQFLKLIGYAWPLALVAVGAYLLLRRR
ncbi:MAG: hypothetical protein U9R25_04855 [Chloroflexota bacterium]|nr:hypothetical protein [Chloroflexota bacterium]